jgi:imidazolonepropionase-like amidohydrolase
VLRYSRRLLALAAFAAAPLAAQAPTPSIGQKVARLLITNAFVIDGMGNPLRGPLDLTVENGKIVAMQPSVPMKELSGAAIASPAGGRNAEKVIDARGMYVMPGIIDAHGHVQFSRASKPMPKDYVYKLWLAHGITTVREPGSTEGIDTIVAHARLSDENRINAPTLVPYAVAGAASPAEARTLVRTLKAKGAAGLKVFINPPDVWNALAEEARAQGLPIATDMKIQFYNASDATRLGVRSIEHWYGIPDAAIGGRQDWPETYNFDDEADRFRWAGDLWRQADPARLSAVIDSMIARKVVWDPTFAIYDANRDITRARTQPWLTEYAHPALLEQFEADPSRHGSYFYDWTTTDEVRWRNNYKIWMQWVREFSRRGGIVTVGSDAGFIWQLYGFCTIRELEMQQEAGFTPLEVIRNATYNGALALGLPTTGVVRVGYDADLLITDVNPLHNFKGLYGTGIDVAEGGKMVHKGGVKYTIKKGIVFDAEVLRAEVREMVKRAKDGR